MTVEEKDMLGLSKKGNPWIRRAVMASFAGATGLFVYAALGVIGDSSAKAPASKLEKECSFDSFGRVETPKSKYLPSGITYRDLDGDGDEDMTYLLGESIHHCENRIPQKNK